MGDLQLITEKNAVLVQMEKNKVPMTAKGDRWAHDDIRVKTTSVGERIPCTGPADVNCPKWITQFTALAQGHVNRFRTIGGHP